MDLSNSLSISSHPFYICFSHSICPIIPILFVFLSLSRTFSQYGFISFLLFSLFFSLFRFLFISLLISLILYTFLFPLVLSVAVFASLSLPLSLYLSPCLSISPPVSLFLPLFLSLSLALLFLSLFISYLFISYFHHFCFEALSSNHKFVPGERGRRLEWEGCSHQLYSRPGLDRISGNWTIRFRSGQF